MSLAHISGAYDKPVFTKKVIGVKDDGFFFRYPVPLFQFEKHHLCTCSKLDAGVGFEPLNTISDL